jgi:hypothetical protein
MSATVHRAVPLLHYGPVDIEGYCQLARRTASARRLGQRLELRPRKIAEMLHLPIAKAQMLRQPDAAAFANIGREYPLRSVSFPFSLLPDRVQVAVENPTTDDFQFAVQHYYFYRAVPVERFIASRQAILAAIRKFL